MKKVNLPHFILLVFLLSWLGIIPRLINSYGIWIPSFFSHFDILMTLGPLLAALIYISLIQGLAGLKKLFGRLLRFRSSAGIILFSVLIPVLLSGTSSIAGLSHTGSMWPQKFDAVYIISNGLIITLSYLFLNTEEIVWRGVVFDRLLEKMGFLKSCMIIAPIWWLFHIPLFLFEGGHPAGYGILPFTLIVIGQTCILGFIYIKTSRSLVYVHLHHQLNNGFGQAFPLFPVFIQGNQGPVWTFSILMAMIGIICLWMGMQYDNDRSHLKYSE